MEQLVLIDEKKFPTEEVIFSHIGRTKSHWNSLFNFIHEQHPDFSEEWRYYKDGKSWLLKVTRKKKTVFWLSVIEKRFRITFYFTDRAEPAILDSKISKELKDQFLNGKHFGKIRGLTITFSNKKDVEFAKSLIDLKLTIK